MKEHLFDTKCPWLCISRSQRLT